MITITSATTFTKKEFLAKAPLGISLRRLAYDKRLIAHIAFTNSCGLPDIYNARISAASDDDILVFIHDDVWIDDYFLANHILEGLQQYDIIGVAGNRRRVDNQPAWLFIPPGRTLDKPYLSGAVAHGKNPFGSISFFGQVPADCELLDGVLLATKAATLKKNGVFFDSRFDFHFYDMDFCRSARQCGLRLGTWPLAITHQSGGNFGNEKWNKAFHKYLEKWKG